MSLISENYEEKRAVKAARKPHGLKIPLYGNQGDGGWTRVMLILTKISYHRTIRWYKRKKNSNTPHNMYVTRPTKPIDVIVMRAGHTISGSLC